MGHTLNDAPMLLRSTLLALVAACCLYATTASAQDLVEVEYRGQVSPFNPTFGVILLRFGLTGQTDFDYYTVRYTMENLEGRTDTVSGFFARPVNVAAGSRYPRLVYQHGTTATKFGVPSRAALGTDLTYLWASQGYVVIAPDFLNMGDDQEGFHPYVHARTEALAAIRMMEALESFPAYAEIARDDQLFLTGYSQGGHASMALHEVLIEEYPDEAVTAAAHMSGPYSISDVMLNEVILADETFLYPGFLPYTLLAYQAVYDDLDEPLDEIFRAPYVPLVQAFRDGYETGAVRLDTLNAQMLRTYAATEGNDDFFPSRYLLPDFVTALQTPGNKYVAALRDNDTYDFTNPTPTRLYYCLADDQVRFRNSTLAADSLNARGASDTEAIDVDSDADHGECVVPAVAAAAPFFAQYAEVVGTEEIAGSSDWRYLQDEQSLRVYTGSDEVYRLELIDGLGRTLRARAYREGEVVELAGLTPGWAVVRLIDARGRSAARKLVIR